MMTRVLILEDAAAVATSLAIALEARGIDYVLATTVEEARAAYEADGFDVLLCDYELPDGTGLDFLATIRGSDKAKPVLWSALDRSDAVAESGLHVDLVTTKDRLLEVLNYIEEVGRDG